MTTFSLFSGLRLRLAAPQPEDAELFARWSNDAEYTRQLDTDYARPRSTQGAAADMERFRPEPNGVTFHLRTLADDRLIGFVSIHSIEWNNQSGLISIGIGDPDYRDQGYGSEALNLALNYGFNELGLYRIGLDVIASNSRAVHAYEKAGFRHEGRLRSAVYRDNQRTDRLLMGILRDDWYALHAA